MMSTGLKRALLVTAIVLVVGGYWCSARAQPAPDDGRIALYRQLLTQANDNIVSLGTQAQALSTENAKLKAEIEKLKPKDCPNGYTRNKDGSCDPPMPLVDKKP